MKNFIKKLLPVEYYALLRDLKIALITRYELQKWHKKGKPVPPLILLSKWL